MRFRYARGRRELAPLPDHSPTDRAVMLPAGKLLPLTRHRPFLLSLVLPLLLGLTPLQPMAEPVEAALSQQRHDYQKALQAVQQSDRATLEELLPRLENYPLYPYL